MLDPRPFGRWLKRLRTELDLTQEALAEEVGCAPQTIRSFESGVRRPSRELAERLADVLHVPHSQRVEFVHLARLSASAPPAQLIEQQQAQSQGHDAGGDTGSSQRAGGQVDDTGPAAPEHSPILATKLAPPRLRASFVARSRLIARLESGRAGPLTLIAAPAGFGKTTLLAEWLHAREDRHLHIAWLSLDTGDSDPIQFLRYLVAALQTIAPTVGGAVVNLLQSAQAPPLELVVPLLLNDLVQLPENSILVLDDYHVIDAPAVHQALLLLLDHLPPQLHLVIASRADPPLPLSRLRARGDLTELRAHDLRFTPAEAATFLHEVMGLAVAGEDVAALEARTEGWIAGLQLAALSLRDRSGAQRTEFIEAFTGSHRFVVDYLVDEVLARQPAHLQTFLLQTSILERLCGPLCDAVLLGGAGDEVPAYAVGEQAYSQLILEQLERNNLFIVPLDDARRWYRYHHLFVQVLRERLKSGASQDTIASLHRRASAWFEQQGLVVEAVQYALAAPAWERAADLIEKHGQLLLARAQVQRVLGWLNMLPETVARARPFLNVIHAGALIILNQLEGAELRLQAAERSLSADTQDDRSCTVLGTTALSRAYIALFRGDFARWLTLSSQALETLPATDVIGRTAASLDIASAFLISGDVTPANERRFAAAVRVVREMGGLSTLFRGIVTLAELQRRQGRLRQAAATYREAAQAMLEPVMLQAMPNGANYYFGLGDLLREWNELDAAEALLAQGREMVRAMLLAEADTVTRGYIALARLRQVRGDGGGAVATLVEWQEAARERNAIDSLLRRGAAGRAHVALLQGDLQTAVHWAGTRGLRVDDDLSYPREPEYLTFARVRIAQGRCDLAGPYLRDALRLLDRLLDDAETGGRMDSVIEILILRALALQAQNDIRAALTTLERALTLAALEGYVRVFLDEGGPMAALLERMKDEGAPFGQRMNGASAPALAYVHTLLAAFPARAQGDDEPITPHPAPGGHPVHPASFILHPPVDPLTERELEVLRLLAAGHSNRAIAAELILALGTVKRHVNNIFGKLQAESRLQAVARARELGLV